jgi:hypothetical protein
MPVGGGIHAINKAHQSGSSCHDILADRRPTNRHCKSVAGHKRLPNMSQLVTLKSAEITEFPAKIDPKQR